MTRNKDLGVITIHDTPSRPKDVITNAVIEDLHQRADRGWKKYNTTLGENNVDDFLQHLYEELLDASQYVKKEIITRKTFYDLTKQYSNDQELGTAVRNFFNKKA
jgi:hypothetical protein